MTTSGEIDYSDVVVVYRRNLGGEGDTRFITFSKKNHFSVNIIAN